MLAIDARRLLLLCFTAVAWIISIPWAIDVWQNGQIPYEPLIGFFLGLASLIELLTGLVTKRLNLGGADKVEDPASLDLSDQTVHGPQTNIAGDVQGPVLSGAVQWPCGAGRRSR